MAFAQWCECVTTDGICSTWGRLGSVCDNTLHLKASQQST